jgi:hypothetical protein
VDNEALVIGVLRTPAAPSDLENRKPVLDHFSTKAQTMARLAPQQPLKNLCQIKS